WQGHTEQGDRQRSQTVVSCNRTQLCSRHETTRSHQHEQDIQHPEHRHFQHLLGGVIDLVCHTCLGNCCFWCSWFNQQHGQHENCYALNDAEGQQGFFVTRSLDHVSDWYHGDGSARAETCSRQTSGQTATIREPFQRITNAGAIDTTSADTRNDSA